MFVRPPEGHRLTPTEARLTVELANGDSIEMAADKLGVTYATARTQRKSIFQKTDIHRQGQLITLLARVRQAPQAG